MPRIEPRSLHWLLFAWYALVLTAAFLLLGYVLHQQLERSFHAAADRLLERWYQVADSATVGVADDEVASTLASVLPDELWYSAWNDDGRRLAANGSELDRPDREHGTLRDDRRLHAFRLTRGGFLSSSLDVAAEHAEVRRFLSVLHLTSLAIIVIALGGGWWIIRRSLRPIGKMTETAERIAAGDLALRIDHREIHNELGPLAQTLNETFTRLQESIARQARFTADASHELRTPLAILHAHLELALSHDDLSESQHERIGTCLAAARRMRGVIEGLLTLARADAGGVSVAFETLAFDDLLRDLLQALMPLATSKGILLEVSTTPITLEASPALLRDAVNNLVTNAITHNDRGTRVRIAIRALGTRASLTVADDGQGIPSEHLPRIFERFYRVDPARSRRDGGTGLGLSIAEWVAQLHGGTLAVRSRAGHGSVFRLTLPRRSEN